MQVYDGPLGCGVGPDTVRTLGAPLMLMRLNSSLFSLHHARTVPLVLVYCRACSPG